MDGYELLKRLNEFIKTIYTLNNEIQDLENDKKYLQDVERGIAVLKITNKISIENIDSIMNELILKYSSKYNTDYKYYGDYISSIDMIVNDIEKLINIKIQNKLNETATKRLVEEVWRNNE